MNAFAQFLANRAKGAKPVVNADTPVTRAEFTQLASVVNALMEDVQAATDPKKLAAVINTAFEAAAKGVTPTTTNRAYLVPKDDPAPVGNGRQPLADRLALAPKGE
ncbi:hypothetical protein [Sphingomonas sp. UBA978]|uniref:hypothetical protein n=1 Tax=Sphingomonas sp. UBA978 TaxID=1947536 RepID=UPI0025E1BF72|nr:hypothetical protein [Sphingomonas sp. UBA978]